MRISIFGLGYVGAVSYGCLVRQGHDVTGVDVDGHKLTLLSKGVSPVVEEGMPELIEAATRSGRARVTSDAAEGVANSDVSFVCVGTPSRRNGAHDLTALRNVCEQLGRAIGDKESDHVTVIRSTVAPGTTEDVLVPILEKASGRKLGSGLHVCFQPEFLREGVSIKDFENPPMTIVGGDGLGVATLRALSKDLPCEFIATSIRTAEMVKFCCNAFHAVKVVFANEVGRLCHGLDMDGREVMSLLCKDMHLNISPAYLRPGFAFGGSCLPKDLRALINMSRDVAVELPLLASVLPSNETQIAHALDIILRTKQRRIGMIGVSFKGGTDDLRESPLLELAERLIGKGMDVRIYDPEVNLSRIRGSNKAFVEESIPHIASIMTEDVGRLVADCKVVVLGVRDATVESYLRSHPDPTRTLIDLVGVKDVSSAMGQYHGICW
jgi:GDP-mannose 6-dehydrogenase